MCSAFPGGTGGKKKKKNLPANAGDIRDIGSTPGSWRAPGGGHGNPLKYSCLKNTVNRGAWRATVHKVAKSQTQPKQLSTHSRWCAQLWNWGIYQHCRSFPSVSVGKESVCSAGDPGLIPGSGRSPREGNGKAVQYSCLGNPMDRGTWRATFNGITRVGHNLATKSLNHHHHQHCRNPLNDKAFSSQPG